MKFILFCVTLDLSENLTEMPIVKTQVLYQCYFSLHMHSKKESIYIESTENRKCQKYQNSIEPL